MRELEELTGLVARFATQEGVQATAIPRLHLIRFSQPGEPLHALHEPALCVIVQGAKKVLLGEQQFYYDPSTYLIVSVTLPVAGEVLEASPQGPYLCLRLDLDREVVRELLNDAGALSTVGNGDAPASGLTLQAVSADLLAPFVQLLRLLDTPEDIAVLSPLAEREILYRALKHGALSPFQQVVAGTGKAQQIYRVVNWLKVNFTSPFSLELLTDEAQMSSSALHQHFKTVTGLTPLQYQKQLRLQEARRLLQGRVVNVEVAAQAVGYESPSQFSREYRRLFGAPPHSDARRPLVPAN